MSLKTGLFLCSTFLSMSAPAFAASNMDIDWQEVMENFDQLSQSEIK
ncbi:MAG: hypothetical protein HRU09_09315 [Oligoflexales bacterium]|nr:hypothetical protein [Oligoflexales bacterium]